MKKTIALLACCLPVAPPTTASAQADHGQDDRQTTVWYLRHSGWAVRGQRFAVWKRSGGR